MGQTQTSIMPTVGRIVHYRNSNSRIIPAIIVEAHDEECINLQVFNNSEGVAFVASVRKGDGIGQWDWMPYQKGQAQKLEELEKENKELINNNNKLMEEQKEGVAVTASEEEKKEETNQPQTKDESVNEPEEKTGEKEDQGDDKTVPEGKVDSEDKNQ